MMITRKVLKIMKRIVEEGEKKNADIDEGERG